jgi:hypothetical protein
MSDCIECKKCDYHNKRDGKQDSRIKDIKHLLGDIKEILNKNYNMNATKNKDLTQDEQLTEILHRLKHLEKGQQAIKSHL